MCMTENVFVRFFYESKHRRNTPKKYDLHSEKGPTLNSHVVSSPHRRSRGEEVKGVETKNEDRQKRLHKPLSDNNDSSVFDLVSYQAGKEHQVRNFVLFRRHKICQAREFFHVINHNNWRKNNRRSTNSPWDRGMTMVNNYHLTCIFLSHEYDVWQISADKTPIYSAFCDNRK